MDRRNWLTLAGSMAVCGCWGCRTAPITGRKQFIWGDEANEVVMGKQAFSQVTSEIADPTPSQYEGIVREVRKERDRPMKVIATGGLASLFAQDTELFDSVEDDLTMHGLMLIDRYNKELETA